MNPQPAHVPVMLSEVVALLSPALQVPEAGGHCVLVDCTLGLGGHAEALLRACPQASLIGRERDPQALAIAGRRLAPFAIFLPKVLGEVMGATVEENSVVRSPRPTDVPLYLGWVSSPPASLDRLRAAV